MKYLILLFFIPIISRAAVVVEDSLSALILKGGFLAPPIAKVTHAEKWPSLPPFTSVESLREKAAHLQSSDPVEAAGCTIDAAHLELMACAESLTIPALDRLNPLIMKAVEADKRTEAITLLLDAWRDKK